MVIGYTWLIAAALALFTAGCEFRHKTNALLNSERTGEYVWQVPEGFPIPAVPADNPMTWEKVALGRQLFYDPRISGDGSISCSSCHQPQLAFTDGRSQAKGIQGNIHPRSAMSLTNVAYNGTLGWDDPKLTRLEDQIPIPLYNMQPPEMGAAGHQEEILARLKKDRRMRRLFQQAFPHESSPVTMKNVIYALASFERTLISGNSPYDRWAYHAEPEALTKAQRAGARLFFSRRMSCSKCHSGFNFSGPVKFSGSETPATRFHNTALYNEDRTGAYPAPNTGVHRHTGHNADMGEFRAPTLRNIALTAPYMHDGSIPTLEEVLDHYAAGGRSRVNRWTAASGTSIDPLMTGFELTPEEKRDLIAFLNALTDMTFVQKALKQASKKSIQ